MAKIAILSGKGGTGKTFLATNLARVIGNCTYLDCDVEEPNGDIFLDGTTVAIEDVTVKVPIIDKSKCNGCRECVDFCRFNALGFVYDRVLVFKNICHSCNGCALVCKQGAISYEKQKVGEVTVATNNDIKVVTGKIKVGTESSVPTISQVLTHLGEFNIVDCPPGSACSVMEAVDEADYCIIVVEPTVFSHHNYLMVKELLERLKLPYGLVVNKDMDSKVSYDDNVIGRIPYNPEIGKLVANGKIVVDHSEEYRTIFEDIYAKVKEIAHV